MPLTATRTRAAVAQRSSAKDVARLTGVSDRHRVARHRFPRAGRCRHAAHGARRGRPSCATFHMALPVRLRSHRSQMVARRRAFGRLRALCSHDQRRATVLDRQGLFAGVRRASLRSEGRASRHRATHRPWRRRLRVRRLAPRSALFALLEAIGRPYVLTWGVDPMRRRPTIGFDNRAATFALTGTWSRWAIVASPSRARRRGQ